MGDIAVTAVEQLDNDVLRVTGSYRWTELARRFPEPRAIVDEETGEQALDQYEQPIFDQPEAVDVEEVRERELVAFGHVSAIENFFPDDQYADYTARDVEDPKVLVGSVGRHLKPDSVSRAMTPAEVGEYALRLLHESNPHLLEQPSTPVAFV